MQYTKNFEVKKSPNRLNFALNYNFFFLVLLLIFCCWPKYFPPYINIEWPVSCFSWPQKQMFAHLTVLIKQFIHSSSSSGKLNGENELQTYHLDIIKRDDCLNCLKLLFKNLI